jgi:aspartate-semialdehyde dehydrogenase
MVALALAPLHAAFGIEAAIVTTLQALSGAVIPAFASWTYWITSTFIGGEEEKIETETRRILGKLEGQRVTFAEMAVSAQCHRVNVADGHMAAIRIKVEEARRVEQLRAGIDVIQIDSTGVKIALGT